MAHLKFHGNVLKQYHGLDKDTVVVAGPGDVIHVSEEKAERLLKDFPTEFEVHHGKSQEAPPPPRTEPMEADVLETETKDDAPVKDKMVKKSKKKDKWR